MEPLERLGFGLVGYGCTTCIGNSGPLDEPVAAAVEEQRPGRRRGALGQPQLRGPHPSAGARQLPRLAAAGRGVRAGRPRRHRPDHASRWAATATAGRSSSPTSGRSPEEIRATIRDSHRPSCSGASTRASSTATTAGGRCPSRPATATPGIPPRPTSRGRPFFEGLTTEPAPVTDIVGRSGAGRARRLGDHRPHLAGRLHPRLEPGRHSGSRSTA